MNDQELLDWFNTYNKYKFQSYEKLYNLKELYLNSNKLTELPESIGNLINLETLNLSNNNIKKLPDSIGNLINLKLLFLHNNNLIELPDSIGDLINLKVLYLDKSLQNNNIVKYILFKESTYVIF